MSLKVGAIGSALRSSPEVRPKCSLQTIAQLLFIQAYRSGQHRRSSHTTWSSTNSRSTAARARQRELMEQSSCGPSVEARAEASQRGCSPAGTASCSFGWCGYTDRPDCRLGGLWQVDARRAVEHAVPEAVGVAQPRPSRQRSDRVPERGGPRARPARSGRARAPRRAHGPHAPGHRGHPPRLGGRARPVRCWSN